MVFVINYVPCSMFWCIANRSLLIILKILGQFSAHMFMTTYLTYSGVIAAISIFCNKMDGLTPQLHQKVLKLTRGYSLVGVTVLLGPIFIYFFKKF